MICAQQQRPSLISSPANTSIGDDSESQDISSEPTVVSPGMYSEEDIDNKPSISNRALSESRLDDGHQPSALEATVLPNSTEGSSSQHSTPNGTAPVDMLHYQQSIHSMQHPDSISSEDSTNRVSLPGFTSIFGDAQGQHPVRRAPSAGLESLKQSDEYSYHPRRSSLPFSGTSTQLPSLQHSMNAEWQQLSGTAPIQERQQHQHQQSTQPPGVHDSRYHGRVSPPDSTVTQFANHTLAPLSSPSFAGASMALPSHSTSLSPTHSPLSNLPRTQFTSKPSSKTGVYPVSDSGTQQWNQRAGFGTLTGSLPSPPTNGVKADDAMSVFPSKPLSQGIYSQSPVTPTLPPPPQTQHMGYSQQAQNEAAQSKNAGNMGSQTTLVVPPAASVPYPVVPPGTSPLPSHIRPDVPQAPRRRGKLPKQVTETLRTWLLDHADHPYPTEEEKKMLCAWTGLSISQVSNWMINARRRILVPASKAAVGPAITSAPYNLAHRPVSAAAQMAGTVNIGSLGAGRGSPSMYAYGAQSFGMPHAGLSLATAYPSSGAYGQTTAHNALPPPQYPGSIGATQFPTQSHHDAPSQPHHRLYY
ncbi:hypothetical protein FRC02_004593 [Tulasnella sp. 418]|nr:hypothetical protein FRC02_004593 [Tulasnella sp. 418]